ncbi:MULTISPECIES: MFS transporter [Lacticaseibacillus]|uniref:MFS transporter n=1 Tax=Lacticaseibacillus TaxID=2759736 RepID=UPI00063DAFE5|nr:MULTISPECIES: MFS transporter [Lacticaseibacillus]KLI74889.1 melibiose symporter [Lacticaseibacillus casei]
MKDYPKNYPLDPRTFFGINTMGLISTTAYYLYTAVLMMFITDYSGIYTGVPGKAAAVATTLLFVGRLWDAVNDLWTGYVIDISRRTRWGKFKPYVLAGTFFAGILGMMLFHIPQGISDFGKEVYLYVVYFLFMLAYTIIVTVPLTSTMSADQEIRSKLISWPRITSNVVGVVFAFFMAIATFLGTKKNPNIPLTVDVIVIPFLIIALIGGFMVKEGPVAEGTKPPKLRDIGRMVKINKPFRVNLYFTFVGGFVWALLTATSLYYIKYAFGVANLGIQSMYFGLLTLVTLVGGTFISQKAMKYMSALRGIQLCYLGMAPFLLLMFAINEFQVIHNPWLFYILIGIVMTLAGAQFVPANLIIMETMDYNRLKLNSGMEATINAVNMFLQKLQSGLATIGVGAALLLVGYNAQTLEKAAQVPDSLLQSLGVVLFGLPAVFSFVAYLLTKQYPLQGEARTKMYAELAAKTAAAQKKAAQS